MKIKELDAFLHVYFYIIETKLNNAKNNLEKLKFQSEEANTDEYLKRYFQQYILENNSINDTNLKFVSLTSEFDETKTKIENLFSFKITNVLLPEQLTAEQKIKIANQKKSVYTNPDLYLEISNGKKKYYESLELKSTKNNNIPGSSVQQVAPFEWVIFIKRNDESVTVSTGFYINSITEKLPFPDRSPRPQIGFKTLKKWNQKYRKEENDILTIEDTNRLNDEKIKLLKDWQDYLASEWLEVIKAEEIKKNEKWFNNAIRKFAVKFLEYSEILTDTEKENLKKNLNLLIK